MIRLTNKKNKQMKKENPLKNESGSNEPKIVEVEKIFVASFHGADVLFVKPKKENETALKLPDNFLQKLILEAKQQS